MPFSLEAVKAQEGDSLILHFGDDRKPQLILIDGGPQPVWKKFLRPRLLAIKAALSPDDPLPLKAVCLSHIDADHVGGLIEMFELLDADRGNPGGELLSVRSLWHNGFEQITEDPAPQAKITRLRDRLKDREAEAVVASVAQGNRLDSLARSCGVAVNREFAAGRAIVGGQKTKFGGLQLLAVAPDAARLDELREEWRKTPPKPEEEAALAAYLDKSVTNLSSLVMIAKQGRRTMLLTGDARGDYVLEGLVRAGVLGADKDATVDFDVVKVPHHGSSHNVEEDFFRRVRGRHYVISGDGRHHNPELEMLRMLADARRGEQYEVWFTYEDGKLELGEKLRRWRRTVEDDGVTVHFPPADRPSVIVDLAKPVSY